MSEISAEIWAQLDAEQAALERRWKPLARCCQPRLPFRSLVIRYWEREAVLRLRMYCWITISPAHCGGQWLMQEAHGATGT